MKIKITADSTCDLSAEIVSQKEIGIMPLFINMGENSFLDGQTIVPEDIYTFYRQNKKLPKSAARSPEEYREFFQNFLDQGYDTVIHFNISEKMSMSHANALAASKETTKKVYVVDSQNLSTGTALLMLHACDLREKNTPAKDIFEQCCARAKSVQASFVIDTLEFLYKGGRCGGLAYLGANLLGLKPCIEVSNGSMGVGKKYVGRYKNVILRYVADTLKKFNTPDKTRCFVTHTKMPEEIVESVIACLKEQNIFAEILETTAGCTVTTHCGEGTLGILYINDGE